LSSVEFYVARNWLHPLKRAAHGRDFCFIITDDHKNTDYQNGMRFQTKTELLNVMYMSSGHYL
jgi:hypothetical protein